MLGLLLVGKQRKQVQKALAELELIPKLSLLYDNFIWRSNGGRQRSRYVILMELNHLRFYMMLMSIGTIDLFRIGFYPIANTNFKNIEGRKIKLILKIRYINV